MIGTYKKGKDSIKTRHNTMKSSIDTVVNKAYTAVKIGALLLGVAVGSSLLSGCSEDEEEVPSGPGIENTIGAIPFPFSGNLVAKSEDGRIYAIPIVQGSQQVNPVPITNGHLYGGDKAASCDERHVVFSRLNPDISDRFMVHSVRNPFNPDGTVDSRISEEVYFQNPRINHLNPHVSSKGERQFIEYNSRDWPQRIGLMEILFYGSAPIPPSSGTISQALPDDFTSPHFIWWDDFLDPNSATVWDDIQRVYAWEENHPVFNPDTFESIHTAGNLSGKDIVMRRLRYWTNVGYITTIAQEVGDDAKAKVNKDRTLVTFSNADAYAMLVGIDGNNPRRLTNGNAQERNPTFIGEYVVYESSRGGIPIGLFYAKVNDSAVFMIPNTAKFVNPVFCPARTQ